MEYDCSHVTILSYVVFFLMEVAVNKTLFADVSADSCGWVIPPKCGVGVIPPEKLHRKLVKR